MRPMIKNALAILFALLCCGPVSAAVFSVERGLNLDTWQSWPDPDRWGERETILPFPEWRRSLSSEGLAALKAAGFDFLRMPVDPGPFLAPQSRKLRGELFDSVVESARFAAASGLKVVVDMHLFPTGRPDRIGMEKVMGDPAAFDAYVELVREMAARLSSEDPERIAFEPMNEPVTACGDDAGITDWPQRQKRLFAAARASAPRLTLILAGGCMASAEGLAAIDPADYPDDNLIWTFHSYAPFLLTHQGAEWAGDLVRYVTGIPFPPHSVPHAELDAAMERIRERIGREAPWARRKGMISYLDAEIGKLSTRDGLDRAMGAPFDLVSKWAADNGIAPQDILLGEFGMIRQEYGAEFLMPGASRAAYVRDMAGRAEKAGFAWAVWSYGGAFGIVEGFGGEKAEPDVLEAIRTLPPRPFTPPEKD